MGDCQEHSGTSSKYHMGDIDDFYHKLEQGADLDDLIVSQAEAYHSWEQMVNDLQIEYSRGRMSDDEFNKNEDALLNDFISRGLLSTEDIYLFDHINGPLELLATVGKGLTFQIGYIQSEEPHFERAVELGLKPKYGVWLLKKVDPATNESDLGFGSFVRVDIQDAEGLTTADLVSIADAPHDDYKSERDRQFIAD